MNKKTFFIIICSVSFLFFYGCNKTSAIKQKQPELYKPTLKTEAAKDNTTYRISSDGIYVYDSPNGNKKINQRASSLLGETHYITVDTDCTVEVLEKRDDWVRINTVYPDWLQDSHNGWIRAKYLYNFSDIKINENDFKILKEIQTSVNNVYILYLGSDITQKQIIALNEFFRNNKKISGNIYLFDDLKASELIDIENLEKNDYLYLADHFISMSTFDVPKSVIYYPYQDFQYKSLGGQNFKN